MTAREYIRSNLNLPNVLTLIRLFLVPVYVVLFVLGQKYAALSVFLAASFTDFLDGRIARKYNLITDFGKLMDPFADKVMVVVAMLSMTVGNQAIPRVLPWAAVTVLCLKELVMILGGMAMLKHGIVVYASLIGKAAQCAFVAGLVAAFFHDWFAALCPGWFATPDILLIWCAIVLALCAMVYYVVKSLQVAKEKGIL